VRTLVIESATEACSAALFEDDELVAGAYEILGRGHAERLVPMISELPGKGLAARVAVSLGPGSFTGVRIGLAAARALGLAWKVPVLGYPTLAIVAAMARRSHPGPVTVCMTGGHGEWFIQNYRADGLPAENLVSLAPSDAIGHRGFQVVAGSQAKAKAVSEDAGTIALDILPDARAFSLLPEVLLSRDLSPIYGRPPDARKPAERG